MTAPLPPADLDLIQQGYTRKYITWDRVRAAVNRALPPCDECGRPANAGGWRQDEHLCAECATKRLEVKR